MTDAPFQVQAQDWEIITLGEAARRGGGNIQTGPFGSQLHASDYVTEGVPSVMPQNIGDNCIIEKDIARIREDDAVRLSKYLLAKGDIVYSRRGDVERRSLVRSANDGWLCGTGCLRIRFGEGYVFPEYAAYYLGHPAIREWIVQHAVGATMPNLNTGILSAVPFVLPPMSTQVEIASLLSALDDKIELNRRMNETLEAMAQAIFRDWFVDFGPVRRKLAGITDPVAIMGGLTPDPARAAELAALFPDALGQDDLPTGWSASAVGNAFNLTMGQSPPGETYNDTGDGLPFFQGRTDFGFRFPVRRKFCSQPTRIANPDDTLISVRAPVGDLNMAWEKCCIGRGVAAARHKAGGKSYTYYAMRYLQPELEQFESEGTVFGAINKKQFEQLSIVEPSALLISAFEEMAGVLDDRLRVAVSENRTLAETRDYLLPRLMSGEVRVGDVAQELAA